MFPPRRENPFRLVGGIEATATPSKPAKRHVVDDAPPAPTSLHLRQRKWVTRDIDAHIKARLTYQESVSWLAAAEAENLSPASIEAAREDTRKFHAEMVEAARNLVVVMPTDLKALCDLTMYLEKHFTALPEEVNGRSLAFYLLHTVRLSLRAVAKYGKHDRDDDE
jgi:hypothetical protein